VGVAPPAPAQYLPPVFKLLYPPQTIISLLVQTAVCHWRAEGALVVLAAIQLSVMGLYRPPVFRAVPLYPPQTIISLSVHTAVWSYRVEGTLVMLVAVQLSMLGLYLPPVFTYWQFGRQ
jgi:hypothetical protein